MRLFRSGTFTTTTAQGTLVAGIVMAASAALAPLAAQGAGGGPVASPRDTARGTVAGAHLLVDYGRPSKRGRVIWGGLVPWGDVWRTGANAATTFVTDKDLVIGGTAVPAGTYTLYSVPSKSGPWLLVVNKQTKQWGTEYHQEQDLARIPLTTSPVSPAVEKFEISIVPEGQGGAIHLAWDATQASVGIKGK
jgi:Protein of unknown function (DUF2911)